MKKKFVYNFGDLSTYRLEYLKRGGDYVTIDSSYKFHLAKKFYLLSRCDFVVAIRLSKIKDGCIFPLLKMINDEVHQD